MQDYVKPYITLIEDFLKARNKNLDILLIGGLAMSFYGKPRYTIDIDGEINCEEYLYEELTAYLKNKKINFNLGENISGWGVVPLPEGYRERALIVYSSDRLTLKVLDPIDFIFSKLMRGTEEDFKDIIDVIKQYNISSDKILEREKLIKYPKDPETFFFKKKFQHLLDLLKVSPFTNT
ncbi:MAG: DUF6036 family nucleotidyltransferase [Thermodesulfovibrionales bacterium]|nr:DUF6036 family nucleotidyltransferase [Thermodesulfovibrionales bacterium]